MNTSPHFRYYLAFVLLTLLGLVVRVQSVAGPEGAAGAKHTVAVKPPGS
ncbi:hypothetical protein [Hymenobacter sp. UV11]|nr:hypothetical protein [Hymenobacter sp. UV11]